MRMVSPFLVAFSVLTRLSLPSAESVLWPIIMFVAALGALELLASSIGAAGRYKTTRENRIHAQDLTEPQPKVASGAGSPGPAAPGDARDAPVHLHCTAAAYSAAYDERILAAGGPKSSQLDADAKAAEDAAAVTSPVCALFHADARSTETSGKASLFNSAQSAAASASVVDSILAVAALRRSHQRYCSTSTGAGMGMGGGPGRAAGVQVGAPLPPPWRRTQLHLKLPNLDPWDLPPRFVGTVNEVLRAHDSGVQLVGACVRQGCIELTLDLWECNPWPTSRDGAASAAPAPAGVAVPNSLSDAAPASLLLSEVLDLPALVLSALGVPPTAAAVASTVAAAADTADGSRDDAENAGAVLVQRGGACWSMVWDPDAMQWQVRGWPSSGGQGDGGGGESDVAVAGRVSGSSGGGGVDVVLCAPLAVHAPLQLDAGAGAPLRIDITISGKAAESLTMHLGGASAAAAASVTTADGLRPLQPDQQPAQHPHHQPPPRGLALIARANGRNVAARVLSCCCSSRAPDAVDAIAGASTCVTAELELDIGYLAAGRPPCSPGLVLQLELWRGPRVLASTFVACLRDAGAVSELREVAAAGSLDLEDDGYLALQQQREETEDLLGDLRSWLDFAAASSFSGAGLVTATAAVATGGGGGKGEEQQSQLPHPSGLSAAAGGLHEGLDLSAAVCELLVQPEARVLLLGAGQHLLEHFVYHGFPALARCVYDDLQPRLRALGAGGAAPAAAGLARAAANSGRDADDAVGGLMLLHRAVRSGSRDMVERVLQWVYDEEYGNSGSAAAATAAAAAAWATRGPSGLTPLHLLAADARCYGSSTAAPSGRSVVGADDAAGAAYDAAEGEAPNGEAAEALLRWVVCNCPASVTVWNTARDCSGNTPAMLWAALGGQDIQVQAAAAALERAVCAVTSAQTSGAADTEVAPSPGAGLRACGAAAATAAATATTITTSPSSTNALASTDTPHAAVRAAAAAPSLYGDRAVAEAEVEAEAQLLASPPRGYLQLLRLALYGFPTRSLECRYVGYVTRTTSSSTLIWVVIMVIAHAAAVYKSPSAGEGRQAFIGGAAYSVSLAVIVIRPRAYAAWREQLMLSCLLGRTLCRLLLSLLPGLFLMSDSVQKYVVFGLDVLLDGFMEGTFEQVRLPRAIIARLGEWPITALLIWTIGLKASYGAALVRSAVVSATGVLMSAVTDVRLRAAFLRELRQRSAGADKKTR